MLNTVKNNGSYLSFRCGSSFTLNAPTNHCFEYEPASANAVVFYTLATAGKTFCALIRPGETGLLSLQFSSTQLGIKIETQQR